MIDFKKILYEHFQFISSSNILITLVILFWSTLNIVHNYKSRYNIIYTILMVIIYLSVYRSDIAYKLRFLFVYVLFSLITISGESFVIYATKASAIKYGMTSLESNVPLWLFSAYLNMILLIHLLNQYALFFQSRICPIIKGQ